MMTMTTNADALPVLIAAGRCGWTEIVGHIVHRVPPQLLQEAKDAIESLLGLPAGSQECLAIIQAAIDWETLNADALDVSHLSSIPVVPTRRMM
jgi:hypothetical protein